MTRRRSSSSISISSSGKVICEIQFHTSSSRGRCPPTSSSAAFNAIYSNLGPAPRRRSSVDYEAGPPPRRSSVYYEEGRYARGHQTHAHPSATPAGYPAPPTPRYSDEYDAPPMRRRNSVSRAEPPRRHREPEPRESASSSSRAESPPRRHRDQDPWGSASSMASRRRAEMDGARRLEDELVELNSNSKYYARKGRDAYGDGDYWAALRYYQKNEDSCRRGADVAKELGISKWSDYHSTGDEAAWLADKSRSKLVAYLNGRFEVAMSRGKSLAREGRCKSAVEEYSSALRYLRELGDVSSLHKEVYVCVMEELELELEQEPMKTEAKSERSEERSTKPGRSEESSSNGGPDKSRMRGAERRVWDMALLFRNATELIDAGRGREARAAFNQGRELFVEVLRDAPAVQMPANEFAQKMTRSIEELEAKGRARFGRGW